MQFVHVLTLCLVWAECMQARVHSFTHTSVHTDCTYLCVVHTGLLPFWHYARYFAHTCLYNLLSACLHSVHLSPVQLIELGGGQGRRLILSLHALPQTSVHCWTCSQHHSCLQGAECYFRARALLCSCIFLKLWSVQFIANNWLVFQWPSDEHTLWTSLTCSYQRYRSSSDLF